MENIVREIRGELTQAEFAKRLGISQAAVAKYEKGRCPKYEILEKIAAAAGKRLVITFEDID